MPKLTLQCSCQVSASCYTTPGSGNSLPLQARIFGENVLTVKGLHLSIIFGSNYSPIHPFLHPSFLLFIISFILTMLSVMDSKINLRHVPVNWTGSWILVSLNMLWIFRLALPIFSHSLDLESLRTKTVLFLKALKIEGEWLDINFRDVSSFLENLHACCYVGHLESLPERTITPSEALKDALIPTSGNLLDQQFPRLRLGI